ncbi:MAG: hypothetical protein ACR2N5_06735 [Solirubrobacterales bacterium]
MPTSTSDALQRARTILEDRLKELDEERRQVERALAEISGGKTGRRGPGRPKGSKNKRRGSTRADQAVEVVAANPGIPASEIAKKLEIAPNYMYRVMADLVKEGRVQKRGRGYHPAATSSPAPADAPAG